MTNPGDAVPYGDDYLVRRLDDLQRQIRELGPSVAASFNSTVKSLTAPGGFYDSVVGLAVTTTLTPILAINVSVPAGFTRAVISVTGRAYAVNPTTAATDYMLAQMSVNGYYGYGLPVRASPGEAVVNVSPFAIVLFDLIPGETIPLQLSLHSNSAAWGTEVVNTAEISGTVIWFR